MANALSDSYKLGDIEGFVRDMRRFGAIRIQVGGISVDFGSSAPMQDEEPVPAPTPTELEQLKVKTKRELDAIMYGSSE